MNAFATYSAQQALFLANERSQELIAEANAHRAIARAHKSRPSRIAAAVASIKAALQAPETSRETTVVPRLSDYPYRG
ncbi:MAG TPA: hypothetical protein VH813_05285 [Candidatus Limnocylindrales bacterium]|jgi:hypothetical protein